MLLSSHAELSRAVMLLPLGNCKKAFAAADKSGHPAPAPTEGLQLMSKKLHPVEGMGHS